jgi:hypothetical protein
MGCIPSSSIQLTSKISVVRITVETVKSINPGTESWHLSKERSELKQHCVMNAWPVKEEVEAQVRKVEDGVHTIVEYPTNLKKNVVE